MAANEALYDYIVIGAGAGGAVVAARLAEAGCSVLVLEAGGDPLAERPGGDTNEDDDDPNMPLADAYRVPAFHAFSSEHQGLARDYYVRHYEDTALQKRDWRYCSGKDGVLYPRAQGLGGCSAHHAMIVVKPNACDWNHIRDLTGDESWRASHMQTYFERIERCRYRIFLWSWLFALTGLNPTGHGWWGWMQTELVFPLRPIRDWLLWSSLLRCVRAAADAFGHSGTDWETTETDPNARRVWNPFASGIRITPLSTRRHVRHGPRERLLDVKAKYPENLEIRLRTSVARVAFDGRRTTGVHAVDAEGNEIFFAAQREVILAAGAFATPKILMLSGIGDIDHLGSHKIAVVENLPGVGRNLQDRYEIGVVSRMSQPWTTLKNASYTVHDREYRKWRRFGLGNYASNGVLFSMALKSRDSLNEPDLHCFSLLGDFRGYYKGYSQRIRKKDYLSWVVLKAYTENRAGKVTLRSANWWQDPDIQFHSFAEGSGDYRSDLDAMVKGVRFVRKVADGMDDIVAEEEEPGRWRDSDTALRDYVAENAWGHHACGTCAIGPRNLGGVTDSRFKVHGIEGLRIVDASVFPRIPGYFLACAVYMIAEKAADALLAETRKEMSR